VRPLVWGNRVFDRWTDSLGAARPLASEWPGRAVLGILGLLTLAAAVAVVVLDWAGWIW
jgi:hypothetical protein